MAWTDQCKISAIQTIDKVASDMNVSVLRAIKEVSKEADIPSETLQKWYYPRQKSQAKNGLTKPNTDEQNEQIKQPEKAEDADSTEEQSTGTKKEVSNKVGMPRRRDEQTIYLKEISKVSHEFDAAWKQMLAAINNAKAEGWISTTKAAALSHLESLTAIVEN